MQGCYGAIPLSRTILESETENMILKTLTHDRGNSDCWNYYDNIESASSFYDEGAKMACVAINFKGSDAEVILALSDVAYLCNDEGQTIERLRPAVKQGHEL